MWKMMMAHPVFQVTPQCSRLQIRSPCAALCMSLTPRQPSLPPQPSTNITSRAPGAPELPPTSHALFMSTYVRFLTTPFWHGYLWGTEGEDGIWIGVLALEVILRVSSGYVQTTETQVRAENCKQWACILLPRKRVENKNIRETGLEH